MCRQDKTAFEDLSGRPLRDGPALRGHAQHLHVLPSPPLSRILCVLHTPRDQRNQSVPRHVHSLSPPYFLSADFSRRNNWIQNMIDLGEAVFSRPIFMRTVQHCASRTGAALVKSPSPCGDASAWTAKTDTALCSLQIFRNPSGRFMAEYRPAFRARREPGPRSHPHVRLRRRLRRRDVPAMLRTKRLRTCVPMSSLLGPCSRPTPPRVPTR
jgi:hypothetical protein